MIYRWVLVFDQPYNVPDLPIFGICRCGLNRRRRGCRFTPRTTLQPQQSDAFTHNQRGHQSTTVLHLIPHPDSGQHLTQLPAQTHLRLYGYLRIPYRSVHASPKAIGQNLSQRVAMDRANLLCAGLRSDRTRYPCLQSSHLQSSPNTYVPTALLLSRTTTIQTDIQARRNTAIQDPLVLSPTLQMAGPRSSL